MQVQVELRGRGGGDGDGERRGDDVGCVGRVGRVDLQHRRARIRRDGESGSEAIRIEGEHAAAPRRFARLNGGGCVSHHGLQAAEQCCVVYVHVERGRGVPRARRGEPHVDAACGGVARDDKRMSAQSAGACAALRDEQRLRRQCARPVGGYRRRKPSARGGESCEPDDARRDGRVKPWRWFALKVVAPRHKVVLHLGVRIGLDAVHGVGVGVGVGVVNRDARERVDDVVDPLPQRRIAQRGQVEATRGQRQKREASRGRARRRGILARSQTASPC